MRHKKRHTFASHLTSQMTLYPVAGKVKVAGDKKYPVCTGYFVGIERSAR